MKKGQIVKNAYMTVFQVVVTGTTLFFAYRYILHTLGLEKIGIWSIVLTTTSASRVGEIGISGSVVKFTAKYMALKEVDKTVNVVQTAVISISIIFGLLLLVAYPLLDSGLHYFLPENAYRDGKILLPYAMLSLWTLSIASVFQAGIDGCNRIDKRAAITIVGSVSYLVFVLVLVEPMGIVGLAYSQLLQSIILLILSWFYARKELALLPVFPCNWSKPLFLEMITYGLNFQIATMASLLYEPVTKILLGKYGGLAMTGYYEMANRMVLQFRTLLVSANQVLVPYVAELQETDPENIGPIFQRSYSMLMYLSTIYYSAILVALPFISAIWIGAYSPAFIFFSVLLVIGWCINSLNAPAYFINLGIGELKWNTISHVCIALMNGILGMAMGHAYGGNGVVLGWILSLSIGSMIISLSYLFRTKKSILFLLPVENRTILIISIVGIMLSYMISNLLKSISGEIQAALLAMVFFMCFTTYFYWNNVWRKKMIELFVLKLKKI